MKIIMEHEQHRAKGLPQEHKEVHLQILRKIIY